MEHHKRRQNRVASIKKAIEQARQNNLELNVKKFVLEVSNMFGCSLRTAKEYIETAQYSEC